MSDSQKKKLSAINKGKTLSQQTRQRISKSMEKILELLTVQTYQRSYYWYYWLFWYLL